MTLSHLRSLCVLLAIAVAAPAAISRAKAQDSDPPPPAGTFFAGTVEVYTAQKITVSRTVLGKTEKREFKITPETKIEGKLRARVRVTVRYVASDDGEIAKLIVVRVPPASKKK